MIKNIQVTVPPKEGRAKRARAAHLPGPKRRAFLFLPKDGKARPRQEQWRLILAGAEQEALQKAEAQGLVGYLPFRLTLKETLGLLKHGTGGTWFTALLKKYQNLAKPKAANCQRHGRVLEARRG